MEEDLELWEGEKGHDHAAAVEKVHGAFRQRDAKSVEGGGDRE